MDKIDVLQGLQFGSRVAEEEGDTLSSYFVETDHWTRLLADQVDIVYGPKGSSKSALYSLLIDRTDELFDRQIILAPAENLRGAPAFKDLVPDPPATEAEFISLWKLYFTCLLSSVFDDYGISSESASSVRKALEKEGLGRGERTLQGILSAVVDYVSATLRPSAIEGGVNVDSNTGLPIGFTGRIVFREPGQQLSKAGYASVDELLRLCSKSLVESDFYVWLALDRFDNAFAESVDLEKNSLRALFHVYSDILAFERIRLKIFLRTDIWQRITEEGFREASHITRSMTIEWSKNSLLNVVARRAVQNPKLLQYYSLTSDDILVSTESQERFFYAMCPKQVDEGEKKPATFDWMLSRTRDGTGLNAPRELIHLLNSLRDKQIRRLEIGDPGPSNGRLFVRATFKDALPEVSRARLEQTLYAEYPQFQVYLKALRGEKTLHSSRTLAAVWNVTEQKAMLIARQLVDVGFFEGRGSNAQPEFWVPFLYRDALDMVQGSAE